MQTLPDFRIGLLNGWLPLLSYLAGFLLAVLFFPREARARLFADPKYTMPAGARVVRLLGQLAMVAYIGMMVFTPLTVGSFAFAAGAVIYAAGYATVLVALEFFKRTPAGQPVAAGPYRFSRNPQWVGLALVLAGAALMTGVWLYLGIILVVAAIYHLQIRAEEQACLAQYGAGFRLYMQTVPRYFWPL